MSLNTYPANPFPPSTNQMDADALETEVSQIKSGLTNVQGDVKLNTQDLTTPSRSKNIWAISIDKLKQDNTMGTWNGNTYTVLGVSYVCTVDNGYVNAIENSGNTSSYPSLNVYIGKLKAGNYKISMEDRFRLYEDGVQLYDSYGQADYAFTANGTSTYNVTLYRGTGEIPSNTYHPMVRLATITDPTFAPYIPSVESRIEAVESGLTNVGDKVFVAYGTQNADSWYKIGEYVLPEPNYIIHNFIIAIVGYQIKQVTLRCTPTGFDNNLTKVNQVYSENKNFAIRLASTSKVELYAKISLRGRHSYSIISESGNADYKVALSDPVESSYTDTDMYIVN